MRKYTCKPLTPIPIGGGMSYEENKIKVNTAGKTYKHISKLMFFPQRKKTQHSTIYMFSNKVQNTVNVFIIMALLAPYL